MKKLLLTSALGLTLLGTALSARAASILNGGFEDPKVSGWFVTVPYGSKPTNWDVLGAPSGNPFAFHSIDHIGTYWQPAEGTQSIDLNGYAHGVIGQEITGLVIGNWYTIEFALSGNPDGPKGLKSVQVDVIHLPVINNSLPVTDRPFIPATSVDNTITQLVGVGPSFVDYENLFTYNTSLKNNTLADMKWETQTFTFKATSISEYLQFSSRTISAVDWFGSHFRSSPFGVALDAIAIYPQGGGTNPVPLPAAAGVGFAMLGGMGIVAGLRKRLGRK